jgi:hypothetical protein
MTLENLFCYCYVSPSKNLVPTSLQKSLSFQLEDYKKAWKMAQLCDQIRPEVVRLEQEIANNQQRIQQLENMRDQLEARSK